MRRLLLPLILCCLTGTAPAAAEGGEPRGTGSFRYVDRHGRVHHIRVDRARKQATKFRGAARKRAKASSSRTGKPQAPAKGAPLTPYDAQIRAASTRHRVPANLIRAVIRVESNFNPRARSVAGAMGLMQLMPRTADELGVRRPFDAAENLDGGVRYLARMSKLFRGDVVLTLAAYHAGPGAVQRFGGVPPYEDTRLYVKHVLAYYYFFSMR